MNDLLARVLYPQNAEEVADHLSILPPIVNISLSPVVQSRNSTYYKTFCPFLVKLIYVCSLRLMVN